jgi:hypothetical protein
LSTFSFKSICQIIGAGFSQERGVRERTRSQAYVPQGTILPEK